MLVETPLRVPLAIYHGYRLLLATGLLGAKLAHVGPAFLGATYPQIYLYVVATYWACSLAIAGFRPGTRGQSPRYLLGLCFVLDIMFFYFLMHASGGLPSGLGWLFIIIICAASILLSRAWVYGLASLTTFMLLGEQLYRHHHFPDQNTYFTHAGVIGAGLFVVSFMLMRFANRMLNAERALTSLVQLNQDLLDNFQTGMLVLEAKGNVLAYNASVLHQLALPDPELPDSLRTTLTSAPEGFCSLDEYGLNLYSLPIGRRRLCILVDAKEQATQSHQSRLAALGTMASQIAHEIRNPLSIIHQASEIMASEQMYHPELLDKIQHGVERVNSVIESTLALAQNTPSHPCHVAIDELLNEWGRLLASHGFSIEVHAEPDLMAWLDPGRLEQIVMNIARNAFEMGADIRFWVEAYRQDAQIVIDLCDDGPGIPESEEPHIFEPFWSTKSEGTGLGLALCQSLCLAEKIHLYYISDKAPGACFRLVIAAMDPTE